MLSEAPSIPDLDESIDASTVSIMSTMSTASTTANRGKRKGAGGKSKATNSKRAKTTRSTRAKKAEPEEPEAERQPETEIQPEQISVQVSRVEVPDVSYDPAPSPAPQIEVSYPTLHESPAGPEAASAPEGLASPRAKTSEPPPAEPASSPSQQSDVENAPPSARAAAVRPPVSSPGQIMPEWSAVDVEVVFQSTLAGEGATATTGDLWDVKTGKLSESEKAMTVQEWIEHVAGQAEAELRAETEKVVGIFEREGARAMTVLEGIVCV